LDRNFSATMCAVPHPTKSIRRCKIPLSRVVVLTT
jgi:hypothetical protein